MLDCTQLTYQTMADLVRAIRNEVAKRKPNTLDLIDFRQNCNEVILDLEEAE